MRGESGVQALVETSHGQNYPIQFNQSRDPAQVPALPAEPTESLVSPRSESGASASSPEVSISVGSVGEAVEAHPNGQPPLAVDLPPAVQNQENCIKYCCPYGGSILVSAVGLGLSALVLDLMLQGRIREATNLGDSPLMLPFFAACAGAILGAVASTAHYFNRR